MKAWSTRIDSSGESLQENTMAGLEPEREIGPRTEFGACDHRLSGGFNRSVLIAPKTLAIRKSTTMASV